MEVRRQGLRRIIELVWVKIKGRGASKPCLVMSNPAGAFVTVCSGNLARRFAFFFLGAMSASSSIACNPRLLSSFLLALKKLWRADLLARSRAHDAPL